MRGGRGDVGVVDGDEGDEWGGEDGLEEGGEVRGGEEGVEGVEEEEVFWRGLVRFGLGGRGGTYFGGRRGRGVG